MTSQPTSVSTRSPDWTRSSMPAREERDGGGEVAVAGVVAQVPGREDLDAQHDERRRRTRRAAETWSDEQVQRRPEVAEREGSDGVDVGGAPTARPTG